MKQRKFKLIKKYPGLCDGIEINDEIDEINDGQWPYRIVNENHEIFLSRNEVENWPEFWQKIKKPILFTEDGKELFEGDEFWYVNVNDYSITYCNYIKNTYCKTKNHKDFSTKELAEKWIEENKPKWSDKSIIDFINFYKHEYDGHDLKYGFNEWKEKQLKSK